MDEGVNSSIVLKLPGVQLNRPRAGRLVDFFCRVRPQDKLKYCQPGFAPRLYLLQLPAQHRSHPLKLFPFNVQQRRAQLLKASHLSRSRHPHHLPVVEQAAHLEHQRQVSGNKSWLTGTTVAAVPVANISSKSPLLQEKFYRLSNSFAAVTWSWPGCRPWGAPSRRRGGCCAASCQAPSCWLASPDVQVLINMFSFNQWESKKES